MRVWLITFADKPHMSVHPKQINLYMIRYMYIQNILYFRERLKITSPNYYKHGP